MKTYSVLTLVENVRERSVIRLCETITAVRMDGGIEEMFLPFEVAEVFFRGLHSWKGGGESCALCPYVSAMWCDVEGGMRGDWKLPESEGGAACS